MTRRPHPKHTPIAEPYIACSDCGVPYVKRMATTINFKTGNTAEEFIWQRDCKHRKAPHTVVTPRKSRARTTQGGA